MPDKKSPLTEYLEELNTRSEQSEKDKIVIPDECGDSLWDDVLKQEEIRAEKAGNADTPDNKTNPSSPE